MSEREILEAVTQLSPEARVRITYSLLGFPEKVLIIPKDVEIMAEYLKFSLSVREIAILMHRLIDVFPG